MNNETLTFQLTRQELPVNIDGDTYVLLELTGKERDAYFNTLGRRLRPGADGKASVQDFEGIEATLVAASLRRVLGGGHLPVTVAEVQAWPARVVSALHKAAQQLSGLGKDEKDGEDAKNE